MKRSITALIIVVAGWFLLPSCSSKYPEKTKQIDTMLSDLEKAKSSVDSVDIEEVKKLYAVVNDQIHFLQKNYKNDTISKSTANFLGDFRAGYKSLQKLKKMHSLLNKEIKFTSTQLQNLKADMGKDLLTEEKINEFIQSEMKAVTFINEKSAKVVNWQKDAIKKTNDKKPGIDSIILEMNRNGIR